MSSIESSDMEIRRKRARELIERLVLRDALSNLGEVFWRLAPFDINTFRELQEGKGNPTLSQILFLEQLLDSQTGDPEPVHDSLYTSLTPIPPLPSKPDSVHDSSLTITPRGFMDSQIGVKTRVTLKTGQTIDGWYFGETPLGYYHALDPEGNTIQFIPAGQWQLLNFDNEGEKARFRPSNFDEVRQKYDSLARSVESPLNQALDTLDCNHIRRIASRLRRIRGELYDMHMGPDQEEEAPIHLVLDARITYEELLDELIRSGIRDIIVEHSHQIRAVLSRDTMPLIDAYVTAPDGIDIDAMIELAKKQDNISKTNLGKSYLAKLSPEALSQPRDLGEPKSPERQGEKSKARLLRNAAAWLKVVGGGGLAAADPIMGVAFGVASAIPTLGVGAVSGAVAVVTSITLGLNAASDALKDMAAILEDK